MAAIDLVVPAVCAVCYAALEERDSFLCPLCAAKLKFLAGPVCQKCGSPLSENQCDACQHTSFDFDLNRSLYEYIEPLDGLLHNFKYQGHTKLADIFAKAMAEYILASPQYRSCSLISAVPLHPVRKRERGYNQSELIAKKVAKAAGITYIHALSRQRYTKSQTHLHRHERLINLNSAFKVRNINKIKGKNLILVDDVFTTGSTLNESSKTLREAGVAKVLGLTACRA